jgi:ankyrin repeat protein
MHEHSTPRELQTALSSIFPQPDLDSRNFSTLRRLISNLEYSSIETAMHHFRATINHCGSAGCTALHWAAWTGNADILQRVLQCGAEINARDNTGRCALHFAAQNGSIDCVRELVRSGANFKAKDNWGRSPLHLAGSDGRNESIRLLLEAGADANARTDREESCLCYAGLAYSVDGIKLLLAAGADLEAHDNIKHMALLDSVWANAHEVTQALTEAGASTDEKGTDGKGVLHAAEMYADVRMCEILGHADLAGLDPYAKMGARIGLDLMTGVEPGGAKIRRKEK